jgi:hypothetical protein
MKAREQRRLTGSLAFFLEALCLHVQAGHDLAHAWGESLGVASEAQVWLKAGEGPWPWRGLSRNWPVESHRLWFALLEELDGAGAPLLPLLGAFATAIRKERARDLEAFCRALPGRLGIVLLLIYLPAAFLLLFGPLILSLPAF